MKYWFIILNISVIVLFISTILGVGFGVALKNNVNYNNQIQTNCTTYSVYASNYSCCNQICNTSIPSCSSLLNSHTSGRCCAVNCTYNDTCYVICQNCTYVYGTYTYDTFIQNITFDCSTNQTCVNNYLNATVMTCWYDQRNPNSLTFSIPTTTQWYIYYIIVILCLLLVIYIIGSLYVMKYFSDYI